MASSGWVLVLQGLWPRILSVISTILSKLCYLLSGTFRFCLDCHREVVIVKSGRLVLNSDSDIYLNDLGQVSSPKCSTRIGEV